MSANVIHKDRETTISWDNPKRSTVLTDKCVSFWDDEENIEVWLSKDQAVAIAKTIIQRYLTAI